MSARLRLEVTRTAESVLRGGHPWLFAESIRRQNRPGQLGEIAVIYDRNDRFLALGLFDPESPLRVRILHQGNPVPIDSAWWMTRLEEAVARRVALRQDVLTSGFRWIHGENDRWPGLVLDRYAQTLVLKLYTAAWFPRLSELESMFRQRFQPERLVLRLSRNVQETAKSQFQLADGQILFGPALPGPVHFLESGLQFEADVVRGQKTGFFLDQRENRRRVETLAASRDVLNAFSFSGGFSLYAARGGARSVTDLDMSPHALQAARRNFARNHSHPAVRSCRHETVQADAFAWLAQAKERFGLVILDPPSMARKETERTGALQAYRQLVRSAAPRLHPGGLLVAASCSAHVPAPEFFELVRGTARASGRRLVEIETTLQPADHPATFEEGKYLKAIYLRVED